MLYGTHARLVYLVVDEVYLSFLLTKLKKKSYFQKYEKLRKQRQIFSKICKHL